MTLQIEVETNDGLVKFSGSLNRDSVPTAWPQLGADLGAIANQNQQLKLDLANIDAVDTAGLAYVLSILKECQSRKLEVSLINTPEGLINLAKLSDVDAILPIN